LADWLHLAKNIDDDLTSSDMGLSEARNEAQNRSWRLLALYCTMHS